MRVPKVAQWVINALLLAGVLMLLSTRMHAQNVRAEKVGQDVLQGPVGKTLCDQFGDPQILVDQALDPDDVRKVLLHESVHVLQMRANGGCRAAMARYSSDPRFALDQELEAYCVELSVFPGSGVNDRLVALDGLSVYFWNAHRGGFTDYVILKAYVAQICNGTLTIPNITFISARGAVAFFKITH